MLINKLIFTFKNAGTDVVLRVQYRHILVHDDPWLDIALLSFSHPPVGNGTMLDF